MSLEIENPAPYQSLNNKTEASISDGVSPASQPVEDTLLKQARGAFIVKVYSILLIQLMMTAGMCCLSYYCRPYLIWQIQNQWMSWVLLVFMLVVQILIICVPIGRRFPFNMILLGLFTLCESYFVSYICSTVAYTNDGPVVLIAAGMTLGMVLVLTVYAFLFQANFLVMIAIIILCSFTMFILLIVSLFTPSPFLTNFYCALGVIIFGIYLVMDTQFIIGNTRFGIQLSMDEYVVAALILYIDIIQIFLYILALLSKK